ncbi:MAG TPA: hypothetical protein EYG02_01620 [Henriciella marina]|uniref:hypothetical protein n=1 Tax=Henriciella sp. TaxID=1968823 RepID=UPI0017AE2565|nr:hypothetical protein [Henriciella sp.]HIG22860.1 hypothetical protein [Henriciella sp.]HIK63712.1 hypothetical protein [Henriciella marina]
MVAPHASAHEIDEKSLVLAEEAYLCTYEGSVTIDTGLEAEISIENTSNVWLIDKGQSIYVVDRPGGEGLVPDTAETGELRRYHTSTRRLSTHYGLQQDGEKTLVAGHQFSDGPGGYSVLLRLDEMRYRTRHDFGGRTGSFSSMDDFGSCVAISSSDDLPDTVAMKEGLTGAEAEAFIDEWEADLNAKADADTRRIMEDIGYSEEEISNLIED